MADKQAESPVAREKLEGMGMYYLAELRWLQV